LSLYERSE